MIKRLSGLISWVVELGLFTGFRIGVSNMMVFHVQNVDESPILADPFVKSFWTIKVIFRVFELSDLQVNFFKSSLICVNVNSVSLFRR